MGSLFKDGQDYAKRTLKEQWKKEKKSLKSNKSKKQPLGDKDDPIDGIVRVAASFVGTVSEAYQYRKQKKQSTKDASFEQATAEEQRQEEIAPSSQRLKPLTCELADSDEHKERGRRASQEDNASRSISTPEDFSEAAWQYDEARQVSEGPSLEARDEFNKDTTKDHGIDKIEGSGKDQQPGDFAQDFIKRHPFDQAVAGSQSPIQLPVVIPQRRPKNRGRGFVRAYSPVLADAGIDQPEFIDFMDSFNKAIKPSDWLAAIELISWAGYAAPEPIALLLDQAAEAATEAAIEAQSRYRSGKFIDRVNAEYFLPRGLVALIVTWKSWDGEQPEPPARRSQDARIAVPRPKIPENELHSDEEAQLRKLAGGVSYSGPAITSRPSIDPSFSFSQGWQDLKSRKATPKEIHARLTPQIQERMKRYDGVFECAETAPLVFPSPASDYEAMVTKKNGKRMNGFDRGEQWLNGFRDRRAQMKWAAKTQDGTTSTLKQHEFRSRYADPSHPAASGDIVAFATGGKWSTRGKVKPGQQMVRQGEVVDEGNDAYSSGDEERDRKWAEKKEKMDRKKMERAKKRADKEKKGGSAVSNLLRTVSRLPSMTWWCMSSGAD